ncbi:MAG: DNA repair protein RecN, partial [Lachnospiraceae bacterium]|nr:DNA repair protein RecN [Lachnospiraceae bacterium]
AQIAAMADTHFVIEKTAKDNITRTDIRMADENESLEELARLLGGVEITDAVRANAGEMKRLANELKDYR